MNPHRLCDVLELLVALVLEHRVELATDLAHGIFGDTNRARLGDALQARRDVDAVAENIVLLDDDVADMYADAELDPPVLRQIGIARGHPALNCQCATHRIDDAG